MVSVWDPIFDWLLTWSSVINAFGSLLLSLLLILLYRENIGVLKAQQKPSVRVSDQDSDGDEIVVYLSNYGDGLAKNIRIRMNVEFAKNDDVNLTSRDPNEVDSHTSERKIYRYQNDQRLRERSISDGERAVEFRGEPSFPTPNGQWYGGFSYGIPECFRRFDVYRFNFWMELVYEDKFDEEHATPISTAGHNFSMDEDEAMNLVNTNPGKLTYEYVTSRTLAVSGGPTSQEMQSDSFI